MRNTKIHDNTIDFLYTIMNTMIVGNEIQYLAGLFGACYHCIKAGEFDDDYKTDLILTLLTASLPVSKIFKINYRDDLKDMLDPALTIGL